MSADAMLCKFIGENIAENKPTFSSHEHVGNYAPLLAVDGRWSQPYLFYIHGQTEPWLAVDLGQE